MSQPDERPPETSSRSDLNQTRLIALLLKVIGTAAALVVATWACFRMYEVGASESASATSFLAALAVMAGAIGVWVFFFALAELLVRVENAGGGQAFRSEPVWTPPPAPIAPGLTEFQGEQVLRVLRELRDISLLTDDQRTKRLETQGRALLRELEVEVPALLREHRWREARQRVQEARERYPSFAQFDVLDGQIESARAQVEARDIEHAERQIQDLSALEAWERAADVVRELLARHPESEKARTLAANVRQKFERSQAEQRARLMAHAQEAVRQRDWQTAVQAANTIIQRYPKSAEAEVLRLQLPTLQENAEIQFRQRAEGQIRELVRQRRYDAALAQAGELIDRYPHSPQAEALRGQLPRLHELAAKMGPSA